MGHAREKVPNLSEKLLKIRNHLGLTQAELVDLMNMGEKVAREDISKFERGVREPSLPILLRYARLVCISTDVLIEEKAELPFSADD